MDVMPWYGVFPVAASLVLPQEMLICLGAEGTQLWVAWLGLARR